MMDHTFDMIDLDLFVASRLQGKVKYFQFFYHNMLGIRCCIDLEIFEFSDNINVNNHSSHTIELDVLYFIIDEILIC